jgi:hypothetical protein
MTSAANSWSDALGGGNDRLGPVAALRQIFAPEIGAARNGVVRDQGIERVAEEFKSLVAAADGFGAVAMHGETGNHRQIGVHGVTQRHACIRFDDAVIGIGPMPCLFAIQERESKRADAVLRRDLDGVAIGAGHPYRRVRRLHRLGQHVAAGHREILALEARIWLQHHHVGDLLRRLQRHRALLLGGDAEAAEFEPRGALAEAEIDPPV